MKQQKVVSVEVEGNKRFECSVERVIAAALVMAFKDDVRPLKAKCDKWFIARHKITGAPKVRQVMGGFSYHGGYEVTVDHLVSMENSSKSALLVPDAHLSRKIAAKINALKNSEAKIMTEASEFLESYLPLIRYLKLDDHYRSLLDNPTVTALSSLLWHIGDATNEHFGKEARQPR